VRLGDDSIAQRGEPNRALGAFDQHHAQQQFQIAQAGGERGLRN
jgi:hypothetical protein